MEEIEEVLTAHAGMYPLSRPQDSVKLVYQHSFGAGHAVRSSGESMTALQAECRLLKPVQDQPLYISIGNHLCRLNLAAAKEVFSLEQINDWFVNDANAMHGSMGDFMHDLNLLKHHHQDYGYTYSDEEFTEYMSWYRGKGFPAVHHSSEYVQAYDPHYRVMYLRQWENLVNQPD